MGHIIPQVIGFFNGIRTDNVKMKLKYDVDWNITEAEKLKLIEAVDKSDFDIVIIIDKIVPDIIIQQKSINELVSRFADNKQIRIYFKEFKVFVNKNNNKMFEIN